MLSQVLNLILNPGGIVVVLTFHSLEDRIVKNAFKGLQGWQILTKTPLEATPAEVRLNPRSRSAKLRACRSLSRSDRSRTAIVDSRVSLETRLGYHDHHSRLYVWIPDLSQGRLHQQRLAAQIHLRRILPRTNRFGKHWNALQLNSHFLNRNNQSQAMVHSMRRSIPR